ncbi:hypothetical protein [Thioflexithrix psekupsensis]|uniref:Uncharacterized protein n=1 Tax=Thioflexithrix psekupsensis TaxID=1570016 RepID=A0A251X7A7_9GAMM|nr:hypothetical protein [Thioflexithrix psekupsensis]OUD13274.1 hypothetical protein TPSD3_11630 [Thioflexithrix psekupsensis]
MTIKKWLLAAWLLVTTGYVSASDMIIIHANDAAHPLATGAILPATTVLTLHKDAEITVIFANGGVNTVRAPWQGTISNPVTLNDDPQLIAGLSHLLSESSLTHRAREQVPDDILWVDISTNKRHYCVADHVTLWRPQADQSASTLAIKHKETGNETSVMWPANQATLAWPNQLPVVYGETYTVELTTRRGSSNFKKLVLYQLPESLPTQSHKVVWMVGRGCIPQANQLLASLR